MALLVVSIVLSDPELFLSITGIIVCGGLTAGTIYSLISTAVRGRERRE